MISDSQLKALESTYSDPEALLTMTADDVADDVLGLVWELRGLKSEMSFLANKIADLEAQLAIVRESQR